MEESPRKSRAASEKSKTGRAARQAAATPAPAAETPAPAGYRLTPAAEEHLQRIASALQVKPDVLVEVAVREWCAAWQG